MVGAAFRESVLSNIMKQDSVFWSLFSSILEHKYRRLISLISADESEIERGAIKVYN
jgi:hypothetical protein